MQISFCQNCGKLTGHKRAIGAGTVLGGVVTGGFSIFAVPFYPKRCVVCGLSTSETDATKPPSSKVTEADKKQGRIVMLILGALFVLFFVLSLYCSQGSHKPQGNAL